MGRHFLVYVRQSYRRRGENADADVSPEAQENAARAALPPDSTAEVISDTGGHRSGRTGARDGYQRLLQRLQDPDVAGVAVYDLGRLARNIHLMLDLKQELDQRNLRLVVANLPGSTFDDSVGRFMFNQLCSAAQFQADIDSDRMISVTRTKHERGGHNGSDPFGYRTVKDETGRVVQPHRLEVVQDEADVVRLIFDRYGRGDVSYGALAAQLTSEGLKRRGRLWVEKGVQDIIRRAPFYLGQVVYRRGEDVRDGNHEPIISPEQAQAARKAAVQRTRRPTHHHRPGRVYLLTRIAYCVCGLRLRGETLVRKGRKEYRYYRCPGRRDGRCASSNIPADAVEQAVVQHIAKDATPPGVLDMMREELRKMGHLPNDGLVAQRKRLNTALERLGHRYTWQEIDEAEYKSQRRDIERELTALPLPPESNVAAFDHAAEHLLPLSEIIRETTPEHQRAIVGHIVESVIITDREVSDITVRLEARPFFSDFHKGEEAVWRWRPRTDSNRRRAP